MKAPAYQWISQMTAAIVVALSLGLVAYELKQSRDIAAAELTLSTQSRNADIQLFLVRPEIFASAREKLIAGVELNQLSTEELFAVGTVAEVTMMNIDSVYLLHTKGLLAEGEWEAHRRGLKRNIKQSKVYREVANPDLIETRPEMLAELQSIWDEIEAENSRKK